MKIQYCYNLRKIKCVDSNNSSSNCVKDIIGDNWLKTCLDGLSDIIDVVLSFI